MTWVGSLLLTRFCDPMSEVLESDQLLLRRKRLKTREMLQGFVVPVVGHHSSHHVLGGILLLQRFLRLSRFRLVVVFLQCKRGEYLHFRWGFVFCLVFRLDPVLL